MENYILKKFSIMMMILTLLFVSNFIEAQTSKVNIPPGSKQTIHGKILDERGNPVIAQVQVWYYNFQEVVFSFGSEEVKGRTDNLIGISYSDEKGFYSIKVPADTILFLISKGPEWELIYERMVIKPNEFDGIKYNAEIKRLYNFEKLGWYGGDTHSHSIHSDGRQKPSEIIHAMKGVGLSWGILTDHNSIAGMDEWLGRQSADFLSIIGNEISTEASALSAENGYGHMNQTFITTLNGTDPGNPNIWARAVFTDHRDVQQCIDFTHEQNGLFIINHPYQNWDWAGRFKSWGYVKNFDAIEVWNGEPPHGITVNTWDTLGTNINTYALQSWFEYLNKGNKISGLAGSDCHDITGAAAYPKGEFFWTTTIGNPRTYAYLDEFNRENIKEAITEGHLFLTSGFGPLLNIKVDGKIPGEVLSLQDKQNVEVSIEVLANHPLLNSEDAVRIILNGKIIKSFRTGEEIKFSKSVAVEIDGDGWIVIEAFGPWPMYAVSNPVFIDAMPLGDWPVEDWVTPDKSMLWNTFSNHPEVSIPDGPSNWKDTEYIFKVLNHKNK